MADKGRLARVHKDRLHQIAETLNAFVIDENGLLLFISRTLADSLGYRGEELLAKDSLSSCLLLSLVPQPAHGRQRFVQCL